MAWAAVHRAFYILTGHEGLFLRMLSLQSPCQNHSPCELNLNFYILILHEKHLATPQTWCCTCLTRTQCSSFSKFLGVNFLDNSRCPINGCGVFLCATNTLNYLVYFCGGNTAINLCIRQAKTPPAFPSQFSHCSWFSDAIKRLFGCYLFIFTSHLIVEAGRACGDTAVFKMHSNCSDCAREINIRKEQWDSFTDYSN